jgi:tetratricopeptide (TPR) repeat protein
MLVTRSIEIDGAGAAAPQARRLLDAATDPDNQRFASFILLRAAIADFDERWNAAVLKVSEGRTEGCEAFFREVLAVQPSFGRGLFMLAAVLEKLDRMREALPFAEQAAKTEGNDPLVLDLLARARSEAGDLHGAAQVHHRAAALAPQDPRILRNAAVSLLRAGYGEEGVGLARISLALQADQPDLIELLEQFSKARRSLGMGLLKRAQRVFKPPKPST